MAAVAVAFLATAFVVPILTPIATTDDWAYTRSVEILYHERRLEIFPVVAATAVFQVAWATLFAILIEPSFGVVRLSTLVMTALGGWALYGILRRLGVSRNRGALGAAAYVFNPLTFALSYSFMTDPHFTALLLIAIYFYLGDVEADSRWGWSTLAGSAAASAAFLTRQQGALIPFAVAMFLLFSHRLTFDRRGLARLLRVAALPAATTIGYYLWLQTTADHPEVQASFLREVSTKGWSGAWFLVRRLTFVETMYVGFFALPIAAAAMPALRRLRPPRPWLGWLLFQGWVAIVLVGVVALWYQGGRMPYVGQFFGSGGLGPPDVLGSRPRLFDARGLAIITTVTAIASLLFAYLAFRRPARDERLGDRIGLLLAVTIWQVVGVLPPSFHYLNRGGSLDRYLLPLLPIGICFALCALRDARLFLPLGWLVIAAFAFFSVAGTRDYLVYMDGVWLLARDANAAGVANDKLDAGSGWDGYHLYEYSRDHVPRGRTVGGPWWVYFYGKATDSTYVVAGQPLPGFVEVTRRSYSSWLEREPTLLYLLRRPEAPWPPPKAVSPPTVAPAPPPPPQQLPPPPPPLPPAPAPAPPAQRQPPPPAAPTPAMPPATDAAPTPNRVEIPRPPDLNSDRP